MQRKTVAYNTARRWIRDGDLLLFQRPRRSLFGRLIATAGRGEYSHAGKAAWWGDDLFCLEIREWYGGRAVLLSRLVEREPGRIDVFETNPGGKWPEYDRSGSTHFMRRLCGCDYGYLGVAAIALLHLPLIRCFVKVDVDDRSVGRRPPFCSHACAMADRIGGGVDPVEHLADRLTEPADLARSPFYRYRLTLV